MNVTGYLPAFYSVLAFSSMLQRRRVRLDETCWFETPGFERISVGDAAQLARNSAIKNCFSSPPYAHLFWKVAGTISC